MTERAMQEATFLVFTLPAPRRLLSARPGLNLGNYNETLTTARPAQRSGLDLGIHNGTLFQRRGNMNRIHIRRLVGVLTGLAFALAAAVAGAPAAFALQYPPPGQMSKYEPVAHDFNGLAGGVTGWQVALIAVGAAIVGAVLAVLVDRAWAARRHRPATAG